MSNPQLNFRLPVQQIARGLQYILALEPYQPPLSASLLVKTLYLDLLAKASFNTNVPISPAIHAAAEAMMNSKATPEERANLWKEAAAQQQSNVIASAASVTEPKPIIINPAARQATDIAATLAKQHKTLTTFEQDQAEEQAIDSDIEKQIALAKRNASALQYDTSIEPKTDSDINSVTDFSPPTDWLADK